MEAQPPPRMPDPQAMHDAEHIKLLVIFHYVWAGLTAVCSLLPVLYVVVGLGMIAAAATPSRGTNPDELRLFGAMMAAIGGFAVLLCWAMAVLTFLAGKFLAERRRPTFILVTSCINCLSMPVGTALGVFTIIVTQRPSVKALFDRPDGALGSFR